MKLSISHKFQTDSLEYILDKYPNRIYDVYFPYPYLPSAIPEKFTLDDIRFNVELCKKYGIKSHLICNAVCYGDTIPNDNLIKFCEDEGINSVGISNYYLLEKTYQNKGSSLIEIEASVLSFITEIRHYNMIKHMLNSVTVAVDSIQDKDFINEVLKDGKIVKVTVNDGCLFRCPIKQIHFARASHKKIPACMCYIIGKHWFNKNNEIDLPVIYPGQKFIDNQNFIWKLNTRTLSPERYIKIIEAYLEDKQENKYENLIVSPWRNPI